MKPKQVKNILLSAIDYVADNPQNYCFDPDTNFKRTRKLPLKTMIKSIIGMGGGCLSNELLDMFKYSKETATSSAFVQQRCKIKPQAFEDIFKTFLKNTNTSTSSEMHILAIDGSDIQIATNSDDIDTYHAGNGDKKAFNLLHLNALYDVEKNIYVDIEIQKGKKKNEHRALVDMVDRSEIKNALIIADRGYESYNNLAHIQEKGWKFLFRIKDGAHGIKSTFELPAEKSFDLQLDLNITRKQTKETKQLFKQKNSYKFIASSSPFDYLPKKNKKNDPVQFYKLTFRIVRFKLSDGSYETIITNLPMDEFPPEKIKALYAARWGIETSFRALKYTLGMLKFHSKKVMCIIQEIYSQIIMYNFVEIITSHVIIKKKQRKYTYQVNFSIAVHICKAFYKGIITSPKMEAIIAKNLVPIRHERHCKRRVNNKVFQGFLYRIS